MAFPAIGTGNLAIPRPSVAKWMFDEVITFNKNNPNSSVKTVNFVLYNNDQATVKVRVSGNDKQFICMRWAVGTRKKTFFVGT